MIIIFLQLLNILCSLFSFLCQNYFLSLFDNYIYVEIKKQVLYYLKHPFSQMQGSVLVHELRKVISLVDLLRDIGLDKQLSLPKVVVLGNQSSGKSSLLEQIVGLDFLPRGSGVVTRRPLQLRMNNIPELKQPYAQFDQIMEGGKKKRFTNFNQVRKSIDEVTDKVCGNKKIIKDIPIVLNVFSANCPNLTIVDLPGITSIPVGEQPKNIYQITKDMALRYVKQPRSIILCVIPANQDLTTSQALKLMRQIDPRGQRSIGCLTKIDIMNRGDDATKMLKNEEVPLRYGYVGVKNRCQEDVLNNVPVSDSLKAEKQFFTKSPIYSTLPRDLFSTESLTKKLTSILYQQIKASLPEIFEEIKHKRASAQQQLSKLGPGVADTEGQLINYAWKNVSNFMRIFTNSLNGIKSNDYNSDPISSVIRQQLTNLYKQQYEDPATIDLEDKDIQKAMINFPGDSTIPGFPSIDAFLALLNPLLKKLQNPAYAINSHVHQIMETQASKIIRTVMISKYPQFNTRFEDLIKRVLQRHRKQLEAYLAMLLDAQISYLYTNDVTYLMGDFALTPKQKKKLESGKIKDPLIFELRKRIDTYFKLAVRNLRDLVPRQVFNFLIIKCLKQLQFETFQFTSDVKKLKELLNEPEQVRNKRVQLKKAIKVFEQSEKRIRMDPQISKLIRDNKRQQKFYSKIGIKSPDAQEKQIEAKLAEQRKLTQKKAQQRREQERRIEQANKNQLIKKNAAQQNAPSNNNTPTTQNKQNALFGNQTQPQPVTRPPINTQPNPNQNQVNQPSAGLNKSPSQTSGSSTNSNNLNMFNMFGTNVPPKTNPQNTTPPANNPVMPKQNNPGTGGLNPSSSTGKDNFQDFWASSTKQQQPEVKTPPPPQPPANKPPAQPDNKGRTATFNQLFGLGGK